jgi:MFS family permease
MKKNIIKTIIPLKNFILLWLGQSLSQFGTAMTSFALIIWVFKRQGTVMSIALLSVFSYLPYVIAGLLAGVVIDRFQKKKIMLICNTIATICSLCAFILMYLGFLQVWHIYLINAVSGFVNAFQSPAFKVSIRLIVPKEHYTRVSGLQSLSDSITSMMTPILATIVLSILGINIIFCIDLITRTIGFFSLLFFVKIPYTNTDRDNKKKRPNCACEILQGFSYLNQNKGFLYLVLFMTVINFLAAMSFYSVLPAIILARTSNNEQILGLVTGSIGLGGIVGGLIVSAVKPPKNRVKTIFASLALSFLLCDILLGTGRNVFVWIFGAFIGNLPLPFFNASENSLLYSKIPINMQGRIFSIRGTFQSFALCIGYLTGGFLADKIFEPLMISSEKARYIMGGIVGVGRGSGMAIIFIITGILGFALSIILYNNKAIRDLNSMIDQ